MDAPPPARLLMPLIVIAGFLLASGAVFFTVTEGDPINPLFRQVLTIHVMVGLVVWALLALGARRLIIGKLPKMQINSLTALLWGGGRVALFIATVTVMAGWLVALALGLALATTFFKALVLLLLVTFFTGITGGALFNSVLVFRHWRKRTIE